jgi:hypothetical protein
MSIASQVSTSMPELDPSVVKQVIATHDPASPAITVPSSDGKRGHHRKARIEHRLQHLAGAFGIDLLAFSCLSNHFHLILRSRPDVVATWDDTEVARRWLRLCPLRKGEGGTADEPNEFVLDTIRRDAKRLAEIRRRLSEVSWWMRLLCQHIAQRANREDGEVGSFSKVAFERFGFWMRRRCWRVPRTST